MSIAHDLCVLFTVVIDHGGKLEVESSEAGGTRFRITLPISEPER